MAAYLYGASIKGIHEYITSTNKLKEIVGASNLLEQIQNFIDDYQCETLVKAAANIKAVVKDESEAREIVYKMPKRVMQAAYGVTFVQAVVEIDGDKPKKEDFDELERRLGVQRNRPTPPLDTALAVMKRSPRTGRPAVEYTKDGYIDLMTQKKLGIKTEGIKDTKQIKNEKNKIAIIHADGNGLGKVIPTLLEQAGSEAAEVLKGFSNDLDQATKKAFYQVIDELGVKRYRKLMLSGDDMMVVIDPNIAVEFTQRYLQVFEEKTKEYLGKYLEKIEQESLTACAGIIFCNEKYPMHHAVRLAEGLNAKVKKIVKKKHKNDVPSALAYANILSGLATKVDDFTENVICGENGEGVKTFFAPYYLKSEYGPSIGELLELLRLYESENAPLSKLRNWLALLGQNQTYAQLVLDRINEIAKSKWRHKQKADEILKQMKIDPKTMLMDVIYEDEDKSVVCKKEVQEKVRYQTIVYDLLTLHSVMDDRSKR